VIAAASPRYQDLSSFSVALLLHGGLLLLALAVQPQAPPGAGSRETAAISLNLIETRIVDASEENANEASDAADAEIAEEAGAERDSAAAPLVRERKSDERESDAKAAGKKPAAAPQTSGRQAPSRPSRASPKGGARARGEADGRSAPGALSASHGAVNSYLGSVRARIASRRPRGMHARGATVVSFGLSHTGGLRYLRLARSSGNRSLDAAALAAVRRAAPFPRPPAGMSLRQLSFSIPFYFK